MALPLISILMPYRDAATTLPDTLDSIARQDCADYELLAVDDGSQDGGPRLLAERARKDQRIRPIQASGRGIVDALNQGLDEARSEIIARMDADDLMRPTRLRKQLDHLKAHPQISLVASQAEKFSEQGILAGYQDYMRWQNRIVSPADIRDEIYVESPLAHPTVTFRRQAVLDLGGYRNGDFPEDYELWLRMNQAGLRMVKLDEVLLDWRDSPGRLSRTDPRYARTAFDHLRSHYLSFDPRLQEGRDIVIWGAGKKTRKRVQVLFDRGIQPAAWVDVSAKLIGRRYQNAEVHKPDWLPSDHRPFVLGYVNNHGIREEIASFLNARGYQRGDDYLMVG